MNPKVIVGLGNPEPRFEWTRHNAGFKVVDAIAHRWDLSFEHNADAQADLARVQIDDTELVLVKPTTYMNSSGVAVSFIVDLMEIPLPDLMIVYDDLALPLGKLRLASSRGAGGHNGVRSVIDSLEGRRDFARMRFAVGPDPGGAERLNFVLSPIDAGDRHLYEKVVALAADAAVEWIQSDISRVMSRYNSIDLAADSQD